MKFRILLALTAVSMIGQSLAEANTGRRSNVPEGVRRTEIDKAAREAARGAGGRATETRSLRSELDSKLDVRLLPEQSRALDELLADQNRPEIQTAAKEIASNSGNTELKDLNEARLEGLANLKENFKRDQAAEVLLRMDPVARAEQSYFALVLTAGSQAKGWSKETRENVVDLLKLANEKIAGGMGRGEAMLAARKEMAERPEPAQNGKKRVKIDLDALAKLCKD